MSKSKFPIPGNRNPTVEVKSKFGAEYRRFNVDSTQASKFDDFNSTVESLFFLRNLEFQIGYVDSEGEVLPINNDQNFAKALSTAKPLLRLIIQRKGEIPSGVLSSVRMRNKNPMQKMVSGSHLRKPGLDIRIKEDFRRISAIIDVDIVPDTCRRVRLMKNGSDKPLGFFIRDGISHRVTTAGVEKVPGIFVSRLLPGGLAESTGLIAVNDEVLEVNGIEVAGKTLDQVTDMMVANSSNLIITVKPANQRHTLANRRRAGHGLVPSPLVRTGPVRASQLSVATTQSRDSEPDEVKDFTNEIVEEEDEDEVKDYVNDDVSNDADHVIKPPAMFAEESNNGPAAGLTTNENDESTPRRFSADQGIKDRENDNDLKFPHEAITQSAANHGFKNIPQQRLSNRSLQHLNDIKVTHTRDNNIPQNNKSSTAALFQGSVPVTKQQSVFPQKPLYRSVSDELIL